MEENKQTISQSGCGNEVQPDSKPVQNTVKKAKKKKFQINIKNMGVNIDRNEYQEIVLSNSNHPEIFK